MEDKSKYSTKESFDKLATITADCSNVLDFLQGFEVTSPRIISDPLLFCVDKRVRACFHRWAGNNIPPTTNVPQNHR